MKFLKAGLIWLAIAVIGGLVVAGSGVINVAANDEHSGIVSSILTTIREASIERRAESIDVPDLDQRELQLAGINDFDAMCTGCHGGPGKDRSAAGRGLNPVAPDLAELANERTPAQLYWVTRNGIRMTGMPAWSASHDDEALWPVVAFISRRLPQLDAKEYGEMLASAGGHGHHADEAAPPASEDHDHSTHEH